MVKEYIFETLKRIDPTINPDFFLRSNDLDSLVQVINDKKDPSTDNPISSDALFNFLGNFYPQSVSQKNTNHILELQKSTTLIGVGLEKEGVSKAFDSLSKMGIKKSEFYNILSHLMVTKKSEDILYFRKIIVLQNQFESINPEKTLKIDPDQRINKHASKLLQNIRDNFLQKPTLSNIK